MPNRKLSHKIVSHNSTAVTQREASEKTLQFLANHEKALTINIESRDGKVIEKIFNVKAFN